MQKYLDAVTSFHQKHSFPVGVRPGDLPGTDLVRVHLIAEELGELAQALAERDLVKTADALADLTYVVVGAAVTYGVPLGDVFDEVHRSNMTKAVRRPGDIRLRDKGDGYRPPDIAGVLAARADQSDKLLRPKVVCLCGSTRFKEQFEALNRDLTHRGIIVLSVGSFCHYETGGHKEDAWGPELAARLDKLHRRKIDMADEVMVINVGGYIGNSTRGEIEYANSLGKLVAYLEPPVNLVDLVGDPH